MATNEGAIEAGNRPPFVVDFASRVNRVRARRPRRRQTADRRAAPVVYVFSANPRFTPFARTAPAERASARDIDEGRNHAAPQRPSKTAIPLHRFTGLSASRALLIGAIACYALILFNLVYGIVSMGYPRSATPAAPARPAGEAARAGAHPLDFRSPLGTTILAGLCRPEVTFDSAPPVALRRTAAPARKQSHPAPR